MMLVPAPVRFVLIILVVLSGLPAARATVPLEGWLVAERACEAMVSIRKGTNPDAARLTPGQRYELLGKNKDAASHYRVRMDGASPPERWVEVNCGTLDLAAPASPSAVEPQPLAPADIPSPPGRFVLAVTWHPAFCELMSRRPECRGADAQTSAGFVLHGLWPQPRERVYCDVPVNTRALAEDGPWSRLPAIELSATTRERLRSAMPGTLSNLHRYQWVKHGSCYGTAPDPYYRHALALLTRLNASDVAALFADNVGRHLSARQVRAAFDAAFGRGAGNRVRLSCDEGMITELRIGLRGRVSESADLAGLMRAEAPASPGCRGGRVDAPGPD